MSNRSIYGFLIQVLIKAVGLMCLIFCHTNLASQKIDTSNLKLGHTYSLKIKDQGFQSFVIIDIRDSSIVIKSPNIDDEYSLPFDLITKIKDDRSEGHSEKYSVGISLMSYESIRGVNSFRPEFDKRVIRFNEVYYQYNLNFFTNVRLSFAYSNEDFIDKYSLRTLKKVVYQAEISIGNKIFFLDNMALGIRIGGFYNSATLSETFMTHSSLISYFDVSQNRLGIVLQGNLVYSLNSSFDVVLLTEYIFSNVNSPARPGIRPSMSFNDQYWNPIGFLGLVYKF